MLTVIREQNETKYKSEELRRQSQIIRKLLRRIEQIFGLPEKAFYLCHKESGRNVRVYHGIMIPDIKQAAALYLWYKYELYDDQYAEAFECDRSTFIYMRKRAEGLELVGDKTLLLNLRRIEDGVGNFLLEKEYKL